MARFGKIFRGNGKVRQDQPACSVSLLDKGILATKTSSKDSAYQAATK